MARKHSQKVASPGVGAEGKVLALFAAKAKDLSESLVEVKGNAPADDEDGRRCFEYHISIKAIADEANCLRQIVLAYLYQVGRKGEVESLRATIEDIEDEAINEYMAYEDLIKIWLKNVA